MERSLNGAFPPARVRDRRLGGATHDGAVGRTSRSNEGPCRARPSRHIVRIRESEPPSRPHEIGFQVQKAEGIHWDSRECTSASTRRAGSITLTGRRQTRSDLIPVPHYELLLSHLPQKRVTSFTPRTGALGPSACFTRARSREHIVPDGRYPVCSPLGDGVRSDAVFQCAHPCSAS